ncbi:MAG: inorganic phosphate transporter, partial [Thermoplasmatota archaeon]
MLFGLTPVLLLVIIVALAAGGYMAWNIGANDVANSMSTAVGAHAITLKQAVVIASVLNFIGAIFLGSHVTETVKSGIVDTAQIGSAHSVMLGFLAAILAASFFVTVATWLELPVSTTHAIIGGITGFGLIAGGVEIIMWKKLGEVAASWVLSPVVGAIIAFIVFRLIVHCVFAAGEPVDAAEKFGPLFVGLTFFIVSFSLFTKTELGTILFGGDLYQIVTASATIFIVAAGAGAVVIRRFTYGEGYDAVEFLFRRLQIVTSCYVAL